MVGQIVWYNIGRGYGFIACGAKQFFFNVKFFAPGFQPVTGRQVKFDVAPGLPGKPPMAINVHYTDVIEKEIVSLAGAKESDGEGGTR